MSFKCTLRQLVLVAVAVISTGLQADNKRIRLSVMNTPVLLAADPVLQRVIAIILVNPAKVAEVNHEGAGALRDYLLTLCAQARIAQFRQPEYAGEWWWPAAVHN